MQFKMLRISELNFASPAVREYQLKSSMEQLKESISQQGVVVPLLVRQSGKGEYSVIAGNRRLKACKELGFKPSYELPCIIVKSDDTTAAEIGLVENIVREGLDSLDIAETINLLVNSYNKKPEEVAKSIGKSRTGIYDILSVYNLPSEMLKAIRQRKLELKHGIILAVYSKNPDLQKELFKRAIKDKLSTKDLATVGVILSEKKAEFKPFTPTEEKVGGHSKVRFEPRKRNIRIEINYDPQDSIEKLFDIVRKNVNKVKLGTAK